MAQQILHSLIFSIATLLFSFFSSTTSSLYEYQTLNLNPLSSSSQTLSWPKPESESTNSLTLPLSHIDDHLSTLSDISPAERFNLRLQRDILRVQTLNSLVANATRTPGGISGNVVIFPKQTEYYIRLGIGTPAQNVYMTLDTGSDIAWLQCLPCQSCYNQSDPIFNPAKSRSYSTVPCGSPVCRKLESFASTCVASHNKTCLYEVAYADGSGTKGHFATETLTFNGASVDHVALGCGHFNKGTFKTSGGIFGLGRGESSFVSQTNNRYNGKFSYCLADWTPLSSKLKPSSTIIFGDGAIPENAVFTPLLTNPNKKLKTFYYLQLLGISVGGKPVPGVTESQFKFDPITGDGGVFIDSGTVITRMAKSAYIPFRDAFRLATSHLKPIYLKFVFETCYDLSGVDVSKVKLPTVVFHFAGANVTLSPKSLLAPLGNTGQFCFSFWQSNGNLSIIGNIHNQGFRVAYDLPGSRVGFLPNAC